MSIRISKKDRDAAAERAAQSPSFKLVPGPKDPHLNKKLPTFSKEQPDLYLGKGKTMLQPLFPPIPGLQPLAEIPRINRDHPQTGSLGVDVGDSMHDENPVQFLPQRSPPPQSHSYKRRAQWERWQRAVIPQLLPVYSRLLLDTKSLRQMDHLRSTTHHCQCTGKVRNIKVAIVRFCGLEDATIEVKLCDCAPAAVQLMQLGAFACAPYLPSLAVDLRVLEFARLLFLQVAPNTSAFSEALEMMLQSMGNQLTHRNSLRRRFGNALQWYTHLRNESKHYYRRKMNALRPSIVPALEAVKDEYAFTEIHSLSATTTAAHSQSQPSDPAPRGRQQERAGSSCSRMRSYSVSPSKKPVHHKEEEEVPSPSRPAPGATQPKRKREPSLPPSEPPFPEPRSRPRPSEHLREACPLCFGDLQCDKDFLVDTLLSCDANFTQKRRDGPEDPVRMYPRSYFVPEEIAARTEAYVDTRRGTGSHQKSKKPRMQTGDEEDGYEPGFLLPTAAADRCENSFIAANEKRGKANSTFFADTGLMALVCRHDRVLFLLNMHSAGEKQFSVIALLETFFQHLQRDIRLGFLYDIVCAFERSCLKWGFLERYMYRMAFAVSVFHAFGHEWLCQLLYHPRKRTGFGFSDGEGNERLWSALSHLVAPLRVTGYHNRLYTIAAQVEYNADASLFRLGEWIRRRYRHSLAKRDEATKILANCTYSEEELRAQWLLQVQTQTKAQPSQSKNLGEQAAEAVLKLGAARDAKADEVGELRRTFLTAVEREDADAELHQLRYETAKTALLKVETELKRKENALGMVHSQKLQKMKKADLIRLRMNARALKRRLRNRLRARKFELDSLEQSFRRLVNEKKLYSHTEAAIKRREPTIARLSSQYNKLCDKMFEIIRKTPQYRHIVPPRRIESSQLWKLDVDDEIWEDIGLDDEDDNRAEAPPLWLCDDDVRAAIKARLQLDRCDEEDARLRKERRAMQVWFAEEWELVNVALDAENDDAAKYQLEEIRDNLVQLCATWQRTLPDLGIDESDLPLWGPDQLQLARCRVDGHRPAHGEDRHYGADDEEECEEELGVRGGEEEQFGMLNALDLADSYRIADTEGADHDE